LESQAKDAGLCYEMEIASDLPQWVIIDQNRLSQMLINLLANAVKFTPKGGVTLEASYQKKREARGRS
jgi:hypothetical protein